MTTETEQEWTARMNRSRGTEEFHVLMGEIVAATQDAIAAERRLREQAEEELAKERAQRGPVLKTLIDLIRTAPLGRHEPECGAVTVAGEHRFYDESRENCCTCGLAETLAIARAAAGEPVRTADLG